MTLKLFCWVYFTTSLFSNFEKLKRTVWLLGLIPLTFCSYSWARAEHFVQDVRPDFDQSAQASLSTWRRFESFDYPQAALKRLGSECTDAQDGLSLRLVRMPTCTKWCAPAYLRWAESRKIVTLRMCRMRLLTLRHQTVKSTSNFKKVRHFLFSAVMNWYFSYFATKIYGMGF